MEIIIPSRVKKQIKQLDRSIRSLVEKAIVDLSNNPRPRGCLKLENEPDTWRIRVGEYRIAYRIGLKSIELVRATHRSKFYLKREL